MRCATLRAILRRAVLAALPLAACQGGSGGYCPDPVEVVLGADPMDPEIGPLFARCQADATDCTELCQSLLSRQLVSVASIQHCELVPGDVVPSDAGPLMAVHVIYAPTCFAGRRPAGLRPRRHGVTSLGQWLAAQAHLEAASVPAFLRLARELRTHAAPAALVRAAMAAAGDERRHARVMTTLARRHGALRGRAGKPRRRLSVVGE